MINDTPIVIGEERLEGELCAMPSARGMVRSPWAAAAATPAGAAGR